MSTIFARWQQWAPNLRSLLRITAALMFMQAGTMKLFSFPIGMPPGAGPLRLFSEIGVAGILEAFGGALLLLGLFTRPTAFLLSGEMAVAYFQAHFPHGFWTIVNGGQAAVFYCFAWLYFSAAGPGPWSLDAFIQKKRDSQDDKSHVGSA